MSQSPRQGMPQAPEEPFPEPPEAPPGWREGAGLRETFLFRFTGLVREGLEATLSWLEELIAVGGTTVEAESAESWTRQRLRAALADLDHLRGYLAALGQERFTGNLDAEEQRLAEVASELARRLEPTARALAEVLGPAPCLAAGGTVEELAAALSGKQTGRREAALERLRRGAREAGWGREVGLFLERRLAEAGATVACAETVVKLLSAPPAGARASDPAGRRAAETAETAGGEP